MTTGEKIKFYRKQAKLTQKQLAEITGLAEITIRQYEAGKYLPKLGALNKIGQALNLNITNLMGVEYTEPVSMDGLVPYKHAFVPPSALKEDNTRNRELLTTLDAIEKDFYSSDKEKLLNDYEMLNSEGKAEANKFLNNLTKIPDYRKSSTTT